jgi:hypothetical protein
MILIFYVVADGSFWVLNVIVPHLGEEDPIYQGTNWTLPLH